MQTRVPLENAVTTVKKRSSGTSPGLLARIAKLEAATFAEEGKMVPLLVSATNTAQDKLLKLQKEHHAQLEGKVESHIARLKETLLEMRSAAASDAFSASVAAEERDKAAKAVVAELAERVGRLEQRVTNLLHEQARRSVRASEAALTDGGHSAMSAGAAATRHPAMAAADASAAAAKRAVAAAEAAELSAAETARRVDEVVKRQQKQLGEGRERERKMVARLDALAQALADQSTTARLALEAEAKLREQAIAGLEQQTRTLERALAAADSELRRQALTLKTLAIEAGSPK